MPVVYIIQLILHKYRSSFSYIIHTHNVKSFFVRIPQRDGINEFISNEIHPLFHPHLLFSFFEYYIILSFLYISIRKFLPDPHAPYIQLRMEKKVLGGRSTAEYILISYVYTSLECLSIRFCIRHKTHIKGIHSLASSYSEYLSTEK